MSAKKIWNLMYVAGNPDIFKEVTANSGNPMKRAEAIAAGERLADKGWRVWVEQATTKDRIFESDAEIKFNNPTESPDPVLIT